VYERDVIKGPWPKGEDAIAKNPSVSYDYAKDIIKKRFLKAERSIGTSQFYKNKYEELFNIKIS
jgi:hypothetical protein